MAIIRKGFIAEGTTCESCAEIIKRQALKVRGVNKAEFNYSDETGHVIFDDSITDIDKILDKIEEKGYTCYILKEEKKDSTTGIIGWTIMLIGILVLGYFLFSLTEKFPLPQISQNMSYGLLFAVGLLTGFHCIAMCGSFVVSYTTKNAQEGKSSNLSHVWYGTGKIISYTLIGAAFGFIGSIIAFTPTMRGIAGVLAGIFLIIFGLRMLNIFPILRKASIKTPGFITRLTGSHNSSPFAIGLLNGLMLACGPLQAIYIMAAGTGSAIEGAKLLFIFALGTLPVMLGFGYFASLVSSKVTHKILKFSGALVIILGLVMVNTGLALTGTGYDFGSLITKSTISFENKNSQIGTQTGNIGSNAGNAAGGNKANSNQGIVIKDGYQEIRMDVVSGGWSPNKFVLKKGVPVKWIINGKQLNGCNNAIQVPKLGLEFDIKPGEQIIEFTPKEAGTITWSCWMGMIQGIFIVKDDVNAADSGSVQKELNKVQVPKGGSCGAGGGGCGCGGGRRAA